MTQTAVIVLASIFSVIVVALVIFIIINIQKQKKESYCRKSCI